MSDEKRITYLGTVTLDDGVKTIAFDIPADADADTIKAAIERAEAEKVAAQARELARLRQMFLTGGADKAEDKPHE